MRATPAGCRLRPCGGGLAAFVRRRGDAAWAAHARASRPRWRRNPMLPKVLQTLRATTHVATLSTRCAHTSSLRVQSLRSGAKGGPSPGKTARSCSGACAPRLVTAQQRLWSHGGFSRQRIRVLPRTLHRMEGAHLARTTLVSTPAMSPERRGTREVDERQLETIIQAKCCGQSVKTRKMDQLMINPGPA